MNKKEYALEYLQYGFSIFPTRGKKPLVAWQQYSNTKPSEEQIIEWWTKWPDADIACATGGVSNVIVVDVDGGNIPDLPPTVSSETSPGHYQFFFKYPGFPIQNSVKIVESNIDIRGNGGFVVLPPSRHFNKDTGDQDFIYRWVIAPKGNSFAEIPQWILDKTREKKPVVTIIQGSTQGSRNNDAASVIGSLLVRYPSSEWESICWPLLQGWNDKNIPPLDMWELRSVFDSIASRQAKNPRQDTYTYTGNTDMTKVENNGNQPIFTFEPIPLSQLNQEETPVEWIWEGYIAKQHLTLFSALWKAGKTTLITNLLKVIQEEGNLADRKTRKAKVLILSEESNAMWARRRAKHEITLPVWISSRPLRQKLVYKDWVLLLEKASYFCKEKQIELLIIDTLSAFWSVDNENDAARVQAALLPLNYLLDDNIAVLLVHHFRKSGGDEGVAARGSGALGAGADILIEFTRLDGSNPNNTERVIKTYSRFEETPKEVVIDYVDEEYITVGTKADVRRNERLDAVKKALQRYSGSVTLSQLHEEWNTEELGKKPSKKSLERYLKALITQGDASPDGFSKVKGGNAALFKTSEIPVEAVANDSPKDTQSEIIKVIEEEKLLRSSLQGKDKNSQEYAEIHKKWWASREKGVEIGAFTFFVPSPNE